MTSLFSMIKGMWQHKNFGINFSLAEPLRPIHEAFQMDIPAHNGDNTFRLPVPATYVINPNREIAFASVNPNWMERAEPAEYLETLTQAQLL